MPRVQQGGEGVSDHEHCKCWRCCDCGKPREVSTPQATVPVELKRRTPQETLEYWQQAYVEQGAEVRRLQNRVAELEAENATLRFVTEGLQSERDAFRRNAQAVAPLSVLERAQHEARDARIAELEVLIQAALDPWEESDGFDPRHPSPRVQLALAMGRLRAAVPWKAKS